jgi:hypothetical protein
MSHPYQPAQNQQAQPEPQYGQQYPPQGPPPYGPPPGGHPQYGGQQPPTRKGSGLAISGLVLGIIAVLLCWVPIVNNFAALLALAGLALGIPALVSARRGRRSGSSMAMASVILSALALVGVLATQAFYGSVIDDVTSDINSAGPSEPGNDESSAEAEGSADDEAGAAAVLSPGQPGQLTEYTVTVDSVTTNANDIVAAENQFNSPPTGQYVLIGLTVTYNGADEGDPWLDLSTDFIGTDARKYDTSSCSAVTPNEGSNVPTLLAGGTATYQVCMDVPPAAIAGGLVEVSECFSFDDVSATWAIQ